MFPAEFPWQIFLSPFGIPIVAILGVFSWLAITSISEAVAKVMCHRTDSDLKLELLARGFSAEEIARVVEAGGDDTPTGEQRRWDPHAARHTAAM
jgi:hypothetical protein